MTKLMMTMMMMMPNYNRIEPNLGAVDPLLPAPASLLWSSKVRFYLMIIILIDDESWCWLWGLFSKMYFDHIAFFCILGWQWLILKTNLFTQIKLFLLFSPSTTIKLHCFPHTGSTHLKNVDLIHWLKGYVSDLWLLAFMPVYICYHCTGGLRVGEGKEYKIWNQV